MSKVQIFALLICLLIYNGLAFAQEHPIGPDPGYVDWGRMSITVTGRGGFNDELSPAQFRLSAVRNARTDAESLLFDLLENTNYSSEQTVGELMAQSSQSINRIRQYVTNYRIIGKPRLRPDSLVELTVEMPLAGEILNELFSLKNAVSADTAEIKTAVQSDSLHSGLLVDCRNLGIAEALAPKVITSENLVIYSLAKVNAERAREMGLVGYYHNAESSEQRVGKTYLLVKGVKITGTNKCDVIIDSGQAKEFMGSMEEQLIFENCRVAFLVD